VPGGGQIFTPAFGEPPWSFGPPPDADDEEEDNGADGDELGVSALAAGRDA
jgi:hypothetical protein